MQNDSFDNKLRKKVLDFEPEYEEEAWGNFAPQLQPPAPKTPNISKPSKWWLYAVAASAVVGGMFALQMARINFKKEKADSVSLVSADSNSNPAIVPVKPITPPTISQQIPSNSNPVTREGKIEKNHISVLNSKNIRVNENSISEKKPSENNLSTKNSISPTNSFVSYDTTQRTLNPSNVDKNSNVILTPSTNSSLVLNPTIKKVDAPMQEWEQSQTQPNFSPIQLIPLPEKPLKNPKSAIYVGVSGIYKPEQQGYGLTGSWRFRPRWSVSVGAENLISEKKEFANEAEFLAENDTEFRNIVPDGTNTNVEFSKIEQNQKQWDLNFSLQYQQPITKVFSATANVGKRILLNDKRRFSYAFHPQGQPQMHEKGDFDYRPKGKGSPAPFFIAAGVQADWRKWQVGVSPQIWLQPQPHRGAPQKTEWALQFKIARQLL